jgi:hypothetical protein
LSYYPEPNSNLQESEQIRERALSKTSELTFWSNPDVQSTPGVLMNLGAQPWHFEEMGRDTTSVNQGNDSATVYNTCFSTWRLMNIKRESTLW